MLNQKKKTSLRSRLKEGETKRIEERNRTSLEKDERKDTHPYRGPLHDDVFDTVAQYFVTLFATKVLHEWVQS